MSLHSCSEMFGSLWKVKPTLEEVLELGGLYCALTSREAGNAQDFMISIMISVYFDMFHYLYLSIICRFLFFSFLFFSSLLVIQRSHVRHWIGGHSF